MTDTFSHHPQALDCYIELERHCFPFSMTLLSFPLIDYFHNSIMLDVVIPLISSQDDAPFP